MASSAAVLTAGLVTIAGIWTNRSVFLRLGFVKTLA
jgi:hypothetical protein